jgi:hypothetical protein
MTRLALIARFEIMLFLSLLTVAVFSMILAGRIAIAGIFRNKKTGAFDPARLQLLVVTGTVALLMLISLGHMRDIHRLELPSNAILYLLGGGEGTYLIAKLRQSRRTRSSGGK